MIRSNPFLCPLVVLIAAMGCGEPETEKITNTNTNTNTITEPVTNTNTVTNTITNTVTDTVTVPVPWDNDGDGAAADVDCNDSNALVNPAATEVCDGIDNNCAGGIDEGVGTDADGDGHYAAGSCAVMDDDCDDANPAVHPGAAEYCGAPDLDCDVNTTVTAGIGHFDGTTWTDKSATGSALSPATVTLDADGTAYFCGATSFTQVVVSADVDLIGDPANRPVIDSFGTGSNVVIDGPHTVHVEGLQISGGNATQDGPFYPPDPLGYDTLRPAGGGIFCQGATLTVDDVIFAFNVAGVGGSIYGNGCDITLSNAVFDDNEVTYSGAGIATTGGAVFVMDSVFSSNTALRGGGLSHYGAGVVQVTDSAFEFNDAARGGGLAFFLNPDGATLDGVLVEGNNTTQDAGGILMIGAVATVNDSWVIGNSAPLGGAACTLPFTDGTPTDATFNRSRLEGNQAVGYMVSGGALFSQVSTVMFDSSALIGNFSEGAGGAAGLYYFTDTSFVNSMISYNGALNGAGAIQTALYAITTVLDSTVSDNTAYESGAGGIENYSSDYYNYGLSNTMTVANTVMWGNYDAYGQPTDLFDAGNPGYYYAPAAAHHNCTQQDLTSFDASNVTPGTDPRVYAASGEMFLDQASPCVDAGDDVTATDAGVDFANLTTSVDGALDMGTVDPGYHTDPAGSWIGTFEYDGSDVVWTTHNHASCELATFDYYTYTYVTYPVAGSGTWPVSPYSFWSLTCGDQVAYVFAYAPYYGP